MPFRGGEQVEVIPIKSSVISKGDDVVSILLSKCKVEDGDIIAIADKAIAAAQGRFIRYEDIKPSDRAVELAKESGLEPGFVELVLRNSDIVFGTAYRTLLTLKNGILVANAGIDHKNAPKGYAALWPEDPNKEADRIREEIERRTGKKVGVIIVDSKLSPLRMGTTGFALGMSGFKGIRDFRGKRDIYGKKILMTVMNLADALAAAAHIFMGEGDDLVPFVLIRGAPVEMGQFNPDELKIEPEKCVYFRPLYLSRLTERSTS
ncbi:coenzyme F420-0:L-glutamate ligase [Candidatus Methanodesulfokora washburnensis]|uniref:Coenzyme F420-0:L-glutamate ligase n=1 Tax=Candidatus Methanodesulfokora washburnensis TaxID=2478471 RepID=A0A3R9X3D9_9CREN|nr:coenzyme F420-0:L-glutamate ligase [Candidatus Methanodesulfokores washburnensis]